MTSQDKKFLLTKVNEIGNILGGRLKIRSVIDKGFTFIPDNTSVPDAFCILQNTELKYHTMRLCDNNKGRYWIEITFSDVPYQITEYWNGKKFIRV